MPSHLGRLFGDPGIPATAEEALRSAVALRVTVGDMEIYAIPKMPQDLMAHQCINQGVQSEGGLYVWDFERRGRQVNVRVDGPLDLYSPRSTRRWPDWALCCCRKMN